MHFSIEKMTFIGKLMEQLEISSKKDAFNTDKSRSDPKYEN